MEKINKTIDVRFTNKEIEMLKLISRLNETIPQKLFVEYELTIEELEISKNDLMVFLKELSRL